MTHFFVMVLSLIKKKYQENGELRYHALALCLFLQKIRKDIIWRQNSRNELKMY